MTNEHVVWWKPGDRAKFAKLAGITKSHLCKILNGTQPCPPKRAETLAKAAKELGYDIKREVWIFRDLQEKHPLFYIKKKKEE